MAESIIKEKSYSFALHIIDLYRFLQSDKKEFILSTQILKSGTSIGANVRESLNAESKKDFIHKLAIAQKEADETLYWLELLNDSSFMGSELFNKLHKEGTEILKILKSIIITSKKNLRTHNS